LATQITQALTSVGVAVTTFSFGFLRAAIDTQYAGVDTASNTRLVTRSDVSFWVFPCPIAYQSKISVVTWCNSSKPPATGSVGFIEIRKFFRSICRSPNFWILYPEFHDFEG